MKQVQCFLALSEVLDLDEASKRFGVDRPELSRAISALEGELGGELFQHGRAPFRLSEFGERMLPMLRQCYEGALAAKALAETRKSGASIPLTLAVARSISVSPLLPFLRRLSGAFPYLQIHLRRVLGNDLVACLDSGEADLAIAGQLSEPPSRLKKYPLFDERFDLFVSREHELSGRTGAGFSDIASETLLINTECDLADDFAKCLVEHGVTAAHFHSAGTHDVLDLLGANLGVAVIPIAAAPNGGLSRVPLNDLDLARTISVYTVANRVQRAVSATLLNMLRAHDWDLGETPESTT
jgi:DNA-binding transcriptional LysR family regulator